MNRTPLSQRVLPSYTHGEEIFNTTSHIVGGGFGIIVLVVCVVLSAIHRDPWAVVSSAIYGASMICLYTMSSVYHGLRPCTGKKVMQILDHCTIYFLIAGTYTPIVLTAIRPAYPGWGWTLFGLVWGMAALGCVFTAIDLKKYSVFSMVCYIGMGWCIMLAVKPALDTIAPAGLLWILLGGICYTVGAVLYGIGKRRRWMHSIFHVFVLLGSILQFFGIVGYVI